MNHTEHDGIDHRCKNKCQQLYRQLSVSHANIVFEFQRCEIILSWSEVHYFLFYKEMSVLLWPIFLSTPIHPKMTHILIPNRSRIETFSQLNRYIKRNSLRGLQEGRRVIPYAVTHDVILVTIGTSMIESNFFAKIPESD